MIDARREARALTVETLLAEIWLHPLFQPILDVARCSILAHEGLIRGPAGSALHLLKALFPAASAAGLLRELEFAAAKHRAKRASAGLFIHAPESGGPIADDGLHAAVLQMAMTAS